MRRTQFLALLKSASRTNVSFDPPFPIPQETLSLSNKLYSAVQTRSMTKSRRIQDRSKNKRVHNLETATEKWKVVSKVLVIIEALKREPEQVAPLKQLERLRQQINLSKPYKVADFVRKSPKLFDLYKDRRGNVWCGLTTEAEDLVEEETKLLEQHTEKAVEFVTRLLMMSVDKRLPIAKISNLRRDIGLPYDFRLKWVHKFPEHFRVARGEDTEYLQLTNWNPNWAITELERKSMADRGISVIPTAPGELSLPFPMKFPPNFKKLFRHGGSIEHFQKRVYLSPYADARGLTPGSKEFDKRAVAIMHEILSFTLEKRLITDHLTHFRREFVMPQKLMRLLLKHYGIFYVSERGKRFSAFLTEAYEGSELIEKSPLVIWKEKVLRLTGYRGKRKRLRNFDEEQEKEGEERDESDRDRIFLDDWDGEMSGEINGGGLIDDESESEMDVGDLPDAYNRD